MQIYLCSCAACTWTGNKPHRDGQCPVCGNALDLKIRERRHSSDLATRLVLSGLSPDRRLKAPLPDLSMLKEYKISEQEWKQWLEAGESVYSALVESIARHPMSDRTRKLLTSRFRGED